MWLETRFLAENGEEQEETISLSVLQVT